MGAFPRDLEKQAPPVLPNHPRARKTSPVGTRTDFPSPPDGGNTPNWSGVASPIWETSWDMGYLGISPFPCSQLVPDPPKFYLKQRVSPPKSREKQRAKLPPASPRLISRHVFRFAFSKALSAPGAAEGARGGGPRLRHPQFPPTAASQDSTVQTPPSSSPPHPNRRGKI